MHKRSLSILAIFIVLLALAACSNKKVSNPIAAVDSKQPDKILFDRAMDAMKHNRFDVARLTLQTLINTYPDSEYVARAKLAVGDSWYAEGGTAAMTQAENEYRDFITFFPNMPEAAEAQLKIANIHYREMEKPDRDFTHALRAQEEYRNLITQFPESKLVPEANARLLEVQEVLAEREFLVGRFYYMRESWNASVARLQTVAETYPHYSKADETLFLLANCYLRQAENFRHVAINKAFTEADKAKMVKEREDLAAAAFDKIVTRYAATDRVDDAKKMLAEMHYPIPKPTPEQLAQSKKEEDSRRALGYKDLALDYIHRGPDRAIADASRGVQPTLTDPQPVSAPKLAEEVNAEMRGLEMRNLKELAPANAANTTPAASAVPNGDSASSTGGLTVETLKGPVPEGQAPHSDDSAASPDNNIPELKPVTDNSAPDSTQATPPPAQENQVQDQGNGAASSSANGSGDAQAQSGQQQDQTGYSTNKPKKKKGLRKLNPF